MVPANAMHEVSLMLVERRSLCSVVEQLRPANISADDAIR